MRQEQEKFNQEFDNTLSKFTLPEETESSWQKILKVIIKELNFDGGFYAQTKRYQNGLIDIKSIEAVNVDEDNYRQAYLEMNSLGYTDYIYKAPLVFGIGVYSLSQVYTDPKFREALGIKRKREKDDYYVYFHKLFGVADAVTYGFQDKSTGINHNFSFVLYDHGHERSKSGRDDLIFNNTDRCNIEKAINKIAIVPGQLRLVVNNDAIPPLVMPDKKPKPKEVLTNEKKLELIDDAVRAEAGNVPDNPNVVYLSDYVRGVVAGTMTQSYESSSDNQQEEISAETLRQRCPALAKWPEGRTDIKTNNKSGKGSRLENAKEFVDRVLEEAGVHETVYLDDLREVNPGFAEKLESLAYRQGFQPTGWFPKRQNQISVEQYLKAKRLVSKYEYKKRKK